MSLKKIVLIQLTTYENLLYMSVPENTWFKYFISLISSYFNFSLGEFSYFVRISSLSLSWIEGLRANSYRALLIVVDDVSNPAAKNTKACAVSKPSVISEKMSREKVVQFTEDFVETAKKLIQRLNICNERAALKKIWFSIIFIDITKV